MGTAKLRAKQMRLLEAGVMGYHKIIMQRRKRSLSGGEESGGKEDVWEIGCCEEREAEV